MRWSSRAGQSSHSDKIELVRHPAINTFNKFHVIKIKYFVGLSDHICFTTAAAGFEPGALEIGTMPCQFGAYALPTQPMETAIGS